MHIESHNPPYASNKNEIYVKRVTCIRKNGVLDTPLNMSLTLWKSITVNITTFGNLLLGSMKYSGVLFRHQEYLLLLTTTDTSDTDDVTLVRQLPPVYGPQRAIQCPWASCGDTRCTYLTSTHCVTVMTVVTVTQNKESNSCKCAQSCVCCRTLANVS